MKQSDAMAKETSLPLVPTPKPKSIIKTVKKKVKKAIANKKKSVLQQA